MAQLSVQQQAVIEWVRNGRGSSFVEAVAGAGKTTTLMEALADTQGSVGFAAYNKKIATEIQQKVADRADPDSKNFDERFVGFGNRVRIGTFHSFGFGAWRRVHPRVAIDARAKAVRTAQHLQLPEKLETFTTKLIGLAKQRALGLIGSVEDRSQWFNIVGHFDLAYEIEDDKLIEQGVEYAIEGLRYHQEIANELIDFEDMIYMPVISGCRMWENDWILVDEAQDTNPARRALARKMLRRNGRAIFVGDRHQAIYGFTGADSDAIDQIVKGFNCTTLPLTVTFRCPKQVVIFARQVVDHIEAHPSAPEGSVSSLEYNDMLMLAKSMDPVHCAILCRNTRPLVDTAYGLIRKGIACHVEGKDIGLGLLKLINRFPAHDLESLRDKLIAYGERETEKLIAKGKETQAEALQDRIDTVLVIADNCISVEDLRQRISDMFVDGDNEQKPTLTLSTVHKSKGREWQRVYLVGRETYMPSRYARQEWQLEQERNLEYVAITRAQQSLIFVTAPPLVAR